MAYSIEIKKEVINRIAKGEKVKNVSEEMGISVPTIYKWKKEIQVDSPNIDNMSLTEQKETSREIKRLIKLKKFDEALEYTDKYPFNPVIQSQKVTIAIEEGDYKTARKIGGKFKNCAQIQSQMVTIAIKDGDYKTAKEIGEKFENYAPIQSQMVTIAIKDGDYKTAKEIGEKFENYAPIQSQMVTIAIKDGDYKTAKEIGKKFENYEPIQSQMVTIAIKEGDYKTAREIGEKFKNYAPIQSQMVKIAIREGNYKIAREIGEKFKQSPIIQAQMRRVDLYERSLSRAEKATDEDIVKEEAIENLKEFNLFKNNTEDRNLKFINKIKIKLYYGLEKIDIEEILKNKELTEKQKLYIALAIYEKGKNIKEIKKLAKKYSESQEIRNINIILQRTQKKKKQIFDWGIYDNLLGWELDEDLKNEYEKTIREQKQMAQKENEIRKREQEKVAHRENEKDKEIKQRNQEQRKQEEKQHRPQTVKENKPTRKNDKNFKQHLKVQIQQDTSKIKQQNEERQQKHIYTEVMEYLLEKRKTIYVKMQSKDLKTQREGISQWDKLEYLIEKTKELKENEGYMENLYGRVTKLKEKEESQLRREI